MQSTQTAKKKLKKNQQLFSNNYKLNSVECFQIKQQQQKKLF